MAFRLVGFGEAMVRYAPMPGSQGDHPGAAPCVRSVGGDELNVCVDLAILNAASLTPGTTPQWVSVLPEGYMGDVVVDSAKGAGVDLSHVLRIPDADVGTFTVIPERKTVHYQRRNSAFAKQSPYAFDWPAVLKPGPGGEKAWLHMTGITPMISEGSRLAWTLALKAAADLGVPVSMDFNHRPQLGTLDELWSVMLPQLSGLEIIIFSVGNIIDLAKMHGIGHEIPDKCPLTDARWRILMARLRDILKVNRLAVCFKTRDDSGLQRRWSAIADKSGVHTTVKNPVYHRPRDECGGGSAWATGLIDFLGQDIFGKGVPQAQADGRDSTTDVHDSRLAATARHADLSAAMCQETVGDHSHVTRVDLEAIEKAHAGQPCQLAEALAGAAAGGASPEDVTLATLKTCGVLAILRAKNPDAAIARGIELVELGAKAIEVTVDSTDWRRVLKTLVEKLPASVCIGVGTVMDDTVCNLEEIAGLGGKFALSPINPLGFIPECKRVGLLAVPSGLSSNELWDLHRNGAKMIKLFHAGQVTAKILKSMLGVSPLAAMNIMPSGGVSPGNVDEWLDAGAAVVGMGSNLAGKEIAHPTGSPEYEKAAKAWAESGRASAKAVFDAVAKRYGQ
eukprot:CAMPEP_0182927644 /NCGR_PEP_ID=MMETSP0105_2-20130417/13893_1 /TAXON_ID=81532 ORGANISM="Acanthoeca-like sp., Strain 10tr" /NCGR_SAMPLE_ID=MMETSP0105_2 /ASSEMBLY_ACC=CAM_ASM_000205 /LENGTH=619 /DNA_ID=CAMNT_0025065601 /DNA_START=14 /DNA_END=1873 /DNA_ORIENTATION=+